ncbi:MAG: sterol desaturase family protein [Gammaproteobacteria bacterium]|jgi:sterol desaturase/sphingolipid hydroxylase (fatty acid hydroxylase superfamily)|nr:sterol desaturase family protein [Gammaproteobacteria bacterium]MBU1406897.1 sterol desaturase family protein [Gammaproteobacteria bacterium]MBU1533040.1 sterol desaturase family protein [Gammaproteobacteria bacterium]
MSHEAAIRLGFFFGVLALMGVWEWLAPRRALSTSKSRRWRANLGIVAVGTAAVRLLIPVTAVGMALLAQERGWGLLNQFGLPYGLALLIGVLVLDCVIYFQHVVFHAVPTLWRLHRMHHSDLDFDVTTGVRFHPIEIVLSMGIKLAAIAVLGPPALAVLVFEIALNATSLFNHGNVRLPAAIDRVLRWFVVTPEMHRVHHSNLPHETNSNFGFSFPWWDRLFGTYRAQPERGHLGMTIGLDEFRDPDTLNFSRLLLQPFRGQVGRYPINRRGSGDGGA